MQGTDEEQSCIGNVLEKLLFMSLKKTYGRSI